MAFIEVDNVKALYASYLAVGVRFEQKLKKQAWGGRDFIVRDPDGNAICFVGLGRGSATDPILRGSGRQR